MSTNCIRQPLKVISRSTAAYLFFISVVFAAEPIVADPVEFDIDKQPMNSALSEFARQSDREILFSSDVVESKQAHAIEGIYDPEDALDLLIADTGLDYSVTDGETFLVSAEEASPGKAQPASINTIMAQNQTPAAQVNQGSSSSSQNDVEVEVYDEILVTAQKREERLQDVPISMTVLSGEDLDRAREEGLTEILRTVPGVAAPVVALGAPSIAIRGVTADFFAFGGAATASYYIDSVPYGFVRSAMLPDANVYDLARIEVLRGPQGTLFGANAQSGVVRILTHDPDLSAFEWKARGSVSSTEDGGTNYRGDLAVNLPLIEDKLAARAVVGYTDRSGWIDKPGTPGADSADISSARLKVKGQLTENFSLLGSYWVTRSRYDTQSIGDEGQNTTPGMSPVSSDADVYVLRANYDADTVDITSATSYFDYNLASSLDLSPLAFLGPFFDGLVQTVGFGAKVFSQEFTFSSTGEGSWRWSAGASYRDDTDRFIQYFGDTLAADYEDSSRSWAVFGELTRAFYDEKLELTVGLRYFDDEHKVDENVSSTGDPTVPLVHDETSFDRLTPRTVLTWHPNDDLTFYASYAQGFRSGLLQQPSVLALAPGFPAAEPDLLHNYELGAKGSLLDGRLQFDTAVFYLDWEDIQQGLSVAPGSNNPALTAILNTHSASGFGFEYSITLNPVERLTLTHSFSWNDLTFDSDEISGGVVVFAKGDRLGFSPEYTAGLSLDYDFPVGRGFDVLTSLSANYTSAIESGRVAGVQMPELDGDSILISRASVMLSSPKNWSLTLFVDNLGDERGPTTRGTFPPTWYALNTRPRTYGLQVEFQM